MKTLKSPVVLVFLIFLACPSLTSAQWTKNESLGGASLVTDIIEFNESIFIAVLQSGIFRSSDHGETWVKTLAPGRPNFAHMVVTGNKLLAISFGKTLVTTNGIDWVEGVGPPGSIYDADSEGDVVFAATYNGLYISIDGGTSWELSPEKQLQQLDVTSVSVSGATVWASTRGYFPDFGKLLRSDDGGVSWTKIKDNTGQSPDVACNSTEVYINIPNDGIYRSTNQGADWQRVRDLTNSEGKIFLSTAGIFYVTAYNVYYSKNGGNTWEQKSKSFPAYSFSSLYVDDENVYLGLAGGGMMATSHTNASSDWRFINNGIAHHYINFFEFKANKLYVGAWASFIRVSDDFGASWSQKSGLFGHLGFGANAIIVKDNAIYGGGSGSGVFKSTDGGDTWISKSQGLGSTNILSVVSTAQSIFAASDEGVYKSTDEADTWIKKTPSGIVIRRLYSNGTALYAASYHGVFESKDDGETWTRINKDAPLNSVSINDVITMGSVVLVATQFDGVHKSTNSGATWTKLNNISVSRFNSHNQYLLMLEQGGQLLMSSDTAKTTTDIGAALPAGELTYAGVIGDDIIAAKAYGGYWTRKASALLKPYVTLTSPRPQNTLSPTESITLKSDQRLFSAPDVVISATGLEDLITIKDSDGNSVAFSAVIAPGEKSVALTITDPTYEVYTITVSPLLNDNELISTEVVASFTVVNPSPVITDITVHMDADRTPVEFSLAMFDGAYQDDQLIAEIIVKKLPTNGQLKFGGVPVTQNQVIPANAIGNLSYTTSSNFSGNDDWSWNASDGISYAVADAKVTIVVPTVTSISEFSDPEILVYPNPASTIVHIELFAVGPVSMKSV